MIPSDANAVVTAYNEYIARVSEVVRVSASPVELALFVRSSGDAVNRLLTVGTRGGGS